jgi:aspartyl-tRNA(Asn)/glutamyl-tRNA(Gln) amidotransferase subunit C
MSDIKDETVETLAKLSRIAVTKEEAKALHNDLSKILDFVNLLDELDTEGSFACNQVIKDPKHLMREDRVKDLLPRDAFLKNAPDHLGGLIKVPPIIIKD